MSDYTPDVLEKIQKAEKTLSTREEVQNTFELVMQPYGNVEDLISPAPLSIALLGQLILLSLETDLSLIARDDDSRPVYLTHPRSLRASLLQVCHAGWDAFNLAHKNMDAIRLKTSNVPTHVNNSVKIIIAGTQDEMQVTLPKALKNVKRIAAECTKKAQEVEKQFVYVMQVISELLKFCTSKRGDHEREIKENKAALQAAEYAQEQMEKEQEMAEQNLKEMKDLLKQSREDYKQALDDMPSTATIVCLGLIEKAGNAMIDVVQTVSNPIKTRMKSAKKTIYRRVADDDESGPEDMDTSESLSQDDIRKLSMSVNGLKDITDVLVQYMNAEKGKKADTDVAYLKARSNRLREGVKKQQETSLSKNVFAGIEQTMSLLDNISKYEGSMLNAPEDFQVMKKKAADLDTRVQKISSQLGVQGANIPTTATPMKSSGHATNSSAVDAAVNQARMKCEQTSQVMRQSMEQYEAANKRTQEANKEMAALVAQISQYELKELDFDKIRETLIQGIGILGQVKEQWSKLVQYFQMMSNIVECTLQESLDGFVESVESGQELRMKKAGQYNLSKVMRDVIYQQASKANQISYLVQGLSGTYVEVSDRHILRPLAGLDKLMALDSDKDKGQIKQIQIQIQRGAEEAAEAIRELVQKRHDEIMEKGYERIAKYEKTMREALPPPSAEEERKMEEVREAAAKPLSEPSVDITGW